MSHPRRRPRFPRFLPAFTAAALAAGGIVGCNAKGADRGAPSGEAERRESVAAMQPMEPATAPSDESKKADDGRYRVADQKTVMTDPGGATTTDGEPSALRVVDSRKIIRTGRVDLVVEAYDAARDRLEALVRAAGGFIDSTQVSHTQGQVSQAVLVIRLPTSTFGDLVPKLRELGEVQAENTDAADITAAYVDVAARLASAQTLEKRLHELVSTRAGTVTEILEVERELARVRGEIEQMQGQIRMWDDQVAMSTLTIIMSTRTPVIAAAPVTEASFGERSQTVLDESVDALANAGQGLAIALIALLPWLPLLLPLAYFGRRYWRRRAAMPRAIIHRNPPPPYPYPPAAYPHAPMAAPMAPPTEVAAAAAPAPSEPPKA